MGFLADTNYCQRPILTNCLLSVCLVFRLKGIFGNIFVVGNSRKKKQNANDIIKIIIFAQNINIK
jgi:hypothetical protein